MSGFIWIICAYFSFLLNLKSPQSLYSFMGNKLFIIKSFIWYCMKAKSRHAIHSPYVYNLVDLVVRDTKKYPAYSNINHSAESLARNPRIIETTDFGRSNSKTNYEHRLESISHICKMSSIRPKYGKLLFRLVQNCNPETIVELGTSLGVSTSYIAKAAPQAKIVSLEGCSVKAQIASSLFEKLSISNVSLQIGRFEDVLPEVLKDIKKIDFAFIDGNHKFKPTINYFNLLQNSAHNHSCFVFDDIHWSSEMEKAWTEITNHPSVSVSIDIFQFGIVFFNKELSRQKFVIRY